MSYWPYDPTEDSPEARAEMLAEDKKMLDEADRRGPSLRKSVVSNSTDTRPHGDLSQAKVSRLSSK